ncbi:asparagine synthase-related protein [Streptomyces marispadix]|uniref:Asparagine synthase-related protein n=1 Tax=Streptomyces marispadix TaxID=2922868 RepID=A0ABS9SSH9_9ACTN|nr:asparagine synthase-related protein [Streptomyces marispadix]MCH6159224.1 asparagine synthase-related protein [Streptomyces marispadix]
MSGSSAGWFVALPDRELPPGMAERLQQHAVSRVSHPSGRPWLLGSWAAEETVVATAGVRKLAVLGTSSATAADLASRLKRVRTAADLEAALRGVRGSFHVAASLDGRGYVRGSASGARRLHRAVVEGVTVCADRARTLAWLTGGGPDTARLAAHLAFPCLPYPLADAAMWPGVDTVTPGQALHLEPDGSCRTAWWWEPPPAELPLAEGALRLREALREAVAVRARPGRILGADLSGGMDSTSLCFLAAEAGARLVTATLHWDTPGNEDHHYARRAAERLPAVEPLVFPSAELPACFTGLNERREPAEEPTAVLRDRARQQHTAHALRTRGAALRLSGHGGDHVVTPPASYVHALLRRSPRTALRHTAGHKAHSRWPLAAAARLLLGPGTYPAWLTAAADRLREDPTTRTAPETWGPLPALPTWAGRQAADRLAALLRSAAAQVRPLAADFGRHAWIHHMREAGRAAALLRDAGASDGLPVESPFCDDAVMDACLAVRPEDAGSPWSYKPLLAAAMDGLVPAHILERTTKDHCGPDWHHGLRAHRPHLAEWAASSHLVTAGVADEEALRRALLSPGLQPGGAPALENTLATEGWLRDLAAHPVPAHLTARRPKEGHPVDAPAS